MGGTQNAPLTKAEKATWVFLDFPRWKQVWKGDSSTWIRLTPPPQQPFCEWPHGPGGRDDDGQVQQAHLHSGLLLPPRGQC